MELRDYFRDELAFLNLLIKEFSTEYPQFDEFIAGSASDRDVTLLLESFAFLTAKLRVKSEDAFPEITQNLLAKVWPTPLRPLPSTAIMVCSPKAGGEIHRIGKNALVKGSNAEQVECSFRVTRDLVVLPLEVLSCNIAHSIDGSVLTLKFCWTGSLEDQRWKVQPIKLFLGTDSQLAGLLQLWFQHYLSSVSLTVGEAKFGLSKQVVKNGAPDEHSLVLPLEIQQYWRLQLLQEYFSFPHVNDFITLDMGHELSELALDDERCFSLTFQFNKPLLAESTIDENTFIPNCVPIINIFEQSIQPIDFETGVSSYQLPPIVDKHVFQIASVYSPREAESKIEKKDTDRGGRVKYLPITQFNSKHHPSVNSSQFYQVMLDSDVRGKPQSTISFINPQGEPLTEFNQKVFRCDMLCTNGVQAEMLDIGEICIPTLSISSGILFHNITKPTPELPPIVDSHKHWPLISHLSFSPVFLRDKTAIQRVIADLNYHSSTNHPGSLLLDMKLNGIKEIDSQPIDWISAGMVERGIRLSIHLDPSYFLDVGDMYRFGHLLGQVFPFCITNNNFLMVDIINSVTQEVWSLEPVAGSRGQI